MKISKERIIEIFMSVMDKDQIDRVMEKFKTEFPEKEEEVSKPRSVREEFTNSRVEKKRVIEPFKNKFVDVGENRDGVDGKIIRKSFGKEQRQLPTNKIVTCSSCKKEIEISSKIYSSEYYKCERCVGRLDSGR
jgi:hypothetical protein